MTCWSSHAWTSLPHQSTWCWKGFSLLFLVVPLLCIPQVPLQEPSQTNCKELCPGKTGHCALWAKLMCRKIPAESTRGLTRAVPHLQIHRKVELNDWTWQLGRTTLSLFNLPCRITWPRQGQETACHTNTTLRDFFFFFGTVCYQGHFWHKQTIGRKWRWFCTSVQTLPEALAIQPWALPCLIRSDWCSGTPVCTSSLWYQARRFQMLHLSHSQDASRAVQ